MSWLWSTPPPEDETSSSADASFTPYDVSPPPSSTSTFPNEPTDKFGTAFSDDIDLTPSAADDSPSTYDEPYLSTDTATTPSFPSNPFPTSTDTLNPSSTDPTTPAIDFSSMTRINPTIFTPGQPNNPLSLNTSPGVDYVFADDYKEIRKKSAAEQLTFLAGSAYLLGTLTGASIGLAHAIPSTRGKSTRLRVNAALNAVAKRGITLGNTFGVLALSFCLSETILYNATNDETLANYAGAGAMAGALYKSTRGIRMAATWGVGGAALALATVYASRQGMYGRGLQGIL